MSETHPLELTTPSKRELQMTRTFDAPAWLIFDALTKPALVQQWLLGPPGMTMPVCEIDLRVGGGYRYVWRTPDGRDMGISGTYTEIQWPHRMVHTERFDHQSEDDVAIVTTRLEEKDGRTTLTQVMLFPTQEIRDAVVASGMAQGVEASFDRVDPMVEGELARHLVLSRVFDAPRELVWKAWTHADYIARWWGPKGFSTRVDALDFEEGGAFRYVMVGPDGTEYPVCGQFQQIVELERIVATDDFDQDFPTEGMPELPTGVVTTTRFEDLGDETRVTLQIAHPTAEQKKVHEDMGVVPGWNSTFDCFAEFLAEMGWKD